MRTNLPQRGYTLIELIVSVALFSVVMLIAGAAFLSLINLDRQARATNDVVTNLSYVVESMERSIRTGTDYTATTGGTSFSFKDGEGRDVTYSRQVRGGKGYVQQCIEGTVCAPLTDPRVDIRTLAFYSRGTLPKSAGDEMQPMVIFVLHGVIAADARGTTVEFRAESAATQRLIDL